MKKISVVLVLVAIATAWYFYRDLFVFLPEHCTDETDCVPTPTPAPTEENNDASRFDMAQVSDITLTPENGDDIVIIRDEGTQKLEAQFKTPDSPIAGSVLVLDEYVTDNTMTGDVFVPYAVNYGGSGSFVSLCLFVQKDGGTLEMRDTYLVGARIVIEKLVLDQNATPHILHIKYRDRKEGEPFAAEPTVPKEATILVSEHRFDGGDI